MPVEKPKSSWAFSLGSADGCQNAEKKFSKNFQKFLKNLLKTP